MYVNLLRVCFAKLSSRGKALRRVLGEKPLGDSLGERVAKDRASGLERGRDFSLKIISYLTLCATMKYNSRNLLPLKFLWRLQNPHLNFVSIFNAEFCEMLVFSFSFLALL